MGRVESVGSGSLDTEGSGTEKGKLTFIEASCVKTFI